MARYAALRKMQRAVVTDGPAPYDPTNLEIRHHLPDRSRTDVVAQPCAWCHEDTLALAETPFRPDIAYIPLMLTCGTELRAAYKKALLGVELTAGEKQGLHNFMTYQPPALP